MLRSNPPAVKTEFCPHLGLQEDTQTCLAYAAEWNLCYRARPAAPVSLEHQRKTCLSPLHTGCPVFQAEKTGPLPRSLRGARRRGRMFWVRMAVLVLLVILGLLAVWDYRESGSWFFEGISLLWIVGGTPAPALAGCAAPPPACAGKGGEAPGAGSQGDQAARHRSGGLRG